MNMTVPIVASTVLCASGRTAEVQGPPDSQIVSLDRMTRGICELTGHYDQVRIMGQAVTRFNASHPLLAGTADANKVIQPAFWLTKHELDARFFAEMASVRASLCSIRKDA